jgi:hypothetical protein
MATKADKERDELKKKFQAMWKKVRTNKKSKK